jgi:hypothetical protein
MRPNASTVEANVDTFNTCPAPTRFISESSLRLNCLRKRDLPRPLARALLR